MNKKVNLQRLGSLDALRGFDMIWIMGMAGVVTSLDKWIGGAFLHWLSGQMEHASWEGLRLMDLVFPTFLFIAGCSFPFSLQKRRSSGEKEKGIYGHILKRMLWLIVLGAIYNGLLRFDFENTRYASVLARIGIAWAAAAVIFMNTGRQFLRIVIAFAVLTVYSLLTGMLRAPGAGFSADVYSPLGSVAGWIDRMFLPGQLYMGNFDPEGIVSTIPAVITALLGMITGDMLLYRDEKHSGRTVLKIMASGLVLLAAGVVWSLREPVIKALWTSSFTLISAGVSTLLLTIFYFLIDVKGYEGWSFFFRVIGMNSLTIYLAQIMINFYGINTFFLGGIAARIPEHAASFVLSCGYVAVCWAFLYFLYKQKIFLKI